MVCAAAAARQRRRRPPPPARPAIERRAHRRRAPDSLLGRHAERLVAGAARLAAEVLHEGLGLLGVAGRRRVARASSTTSRGSWRPRRTPPASARSRAWPPTCPGPASPRGTAPGSAWTSPPASRRPGAMRRDLPGLGLVLDVLQAAPCSFMSALRFSIASVRRHLRRRRAAPVTAHHGQARHHHGRAQHRSWISSRLLVSARGALAGPRVRYFPILLRIGGMLLRYWAIAARSAWVRSLYPASVPSITSAIRPPATSPSGLLPLPR